MYLRFNSWGNLFLIYMADVFDSVKGTKLFADDMKIYRNISSVKDVKILLEDVLNFNASKCLLYTSEQHLANFIY